MNAFGPAGGGLALLQTAGGAAAGWELFAGAVLLGVVHGVEPGHGWPVAASYALDRPNKWLAGFTASLLLGVGHLTSSLAVVGAFFVAKRQFDLTRLSRPVVLHLGDAPVAVGSPMSLVAGVLLVLLGVREYRHGHSHGHGHEEHSHDDHGGADHEHDRGGHDHPHGHTHERDRSHDEGWFARLPSALPFVGGHGHSHGSLDDAADRGLWGIASFAFVLGFVHEEEFEILALCTGSSACLELMTAYALAVVGALVALTLALVAGYYRFEERVEAYAAHLPLFSAAVLVVMGLGFALGLF